MTLIFGPVGVGGQEEGCAAAEVAIAVTAERRSSFPMVSEVGCYRLCKSNRGEFEQRTSNGL